MFITTAGGGAIAGSLIGGLLGGQSGQATSMVDKSPWAPAAPWLTNNLKSGEALQNYYSANPFSAAQQGAYNNSFGLSNAYRSALPGLLTQMSQNTGFDPANPLQKPKGYDFSQLAQGFGNLGFSPVQPTYGAPDLTKYQPAAAPAATNPWGDNRFTAAGQM